MQLFGRDQRKAVAKIEAHLVAEHAERAGTGAVFLRRPRVAHQAHHVEILAHQALAAGGRTVGHHQQRAPRRIIGRQRTCPMVTQSSAM